MRTASVLACVVACITAAGRAPTIAEPLPPDATSLPVFTPESGTVRLETRAVRFSRAPRGAVPGGLLDGWSRRGEHDRTSRRTFVWATAERATVRLEVLQVGDLQGIVTLRPFPGDPPLEIEVSVNDSPAIARWKTRRGFWEYRFVLPVSALETGPNDLVFRHSRLGRADNPRDERAFGAGYSTMLLGPNCLPLRPRGEPRAPGVEVVKGGRVVTGPASWSQSVNVTEGSLFHVSASLDSDAAGAATVALRIDGEPATSLRLGPSILGNPSRDLDWDLSPWSGRRVDLGIDVRPEHCDAATTTVRLTEARLTRSD